MPYLRWEVDAEVPDSFFYGIRQGLVWMHNYVTSLGIPKFENRIDIYVYEDVTPILVREKGMSEEEARQHLERYPQPEARVREDGTGEILFKLPEGFRDTLGRDLLTSLGAHELAHVYQYSLEADSGGRGGGSHSDVPAQGPAWLIEGGAEFQAVRAMASGESLIYGQKRNRDAGLARTVTTPLSEMETFEVFLATFRGYRLAEMAAELLASRGGEKAMITYWTLLGQETPWEEAFETAFGMTVSEFYRTFEEHRAAGFPEVDLPSLGLSIEDLPQDDRPVLVALYNLTNGEGWAHNSNWLSDAHIGRWHGVTVGVSGRVTELILGENRLRGELPPQLGSLTELTTLILWGNAVTGSIPPELSSLSNLVYFFVAGNSLTGCVPGELSSVPNNDFAEAGLPFCGQ